MASQTYRYTAATFGGTSITSLKSATLNKSATVTDFNADAKRYAQGAFVDSVVSRITITTADAAFLEEANYTPGTTGAVVLTGKVRSGATDGDTITQTAANAVLIGVDASAEYEGEGTATLEFAAYSADGDTDPIAQAIA